MIRPLEPSTVSKGFFVVCDIENNPDGSVIAIDTAWRDNQTQQIIHVEHPTWEAWCDWLFPMARADERFRTVYAHNGGGWDWLSLIHYLLTDGKDKRQTLTANLAASKVITCNINIAKKLSIHLCDSLQLLRSSLDKLGQKFCGRGKLDTGGKLPHELSVEKRREYQRGDTELLLEVLERALDLLREKVAPIGRLGYTIGSTAMLAFRTLALKENISIPWCPIEKEFFRSGYTGGRVEVFKYGHFKKCRVYDVNSLYPYAMLTTCVPTSDRTNRVNPAAPIPVDSIGVYRINFEQRNHNLPPVLTDRGRGIYAGNGVYFTPELHLLREVDPTAIIEVVDGYEFLDTGKIFQDYVNKLYALRLTDKDGPLSLLCKYLLNSLYGKFGQKTLRESIVSANDLGDIEWMIPEVGESPLSVIDEARGIYCITKETPCSFEHIGIAGMITSAARATLYRGMLAVGVENLIYCDTDSVHTTGIMPKAMVGEALGQFKVEFSGAGVYCGKKLYGLKDEKGNEKIRAKGVSVGGGNGCRLNFSDMLGISKGGKFLAKFQQPTTALQVFHLAPPCKFGPRQRTLKVT